MIRAPIILGLGFIALYGWYNYAPSFTGRPADAFIAVPYDDPWTGIIAPVTSARSPGLPFVIPNFRDEFSTEHKFRVPATGQVVGKRDDIPAPNLIQRENGVPFAYWRFGETGMRCNVANYVVNEVEASETSHHVRAYFGCQSWFS
jgi:hypothetical protein